MKVWYRAGIELETPGSAVRHTFVARHVTDCATRPSLDFIDLSVHLVFIFSHLKFFLIQKLYETMSYCELRAQQAGLEIIKPFSCSTQLSAKFIMLINVKMPTIIVILTFISMTNTPSESLKARKVFLL